MFKSKATHASLTVVEEDTLSGILDSFLEVGILKDDVGALTTELKGDLLDVGLGSLLHNLSADGCGTSESDLVDGGVTSKGITDSLTVTSKESEWGDQLIVKSTYPTTTLMTPLGRPASLKSLVMYMAVKGVSSEGLITTVLPAARAGAIFHENMRRGKFQGII